MLDGLSKVGGKDGTRAAGLDETSARRLAASLEGLDTLQPGLSERTLSYVLFGDGAEVLLELAGTAGTSEALGLRCRGRYLGSDHPGREELFAGLECRDATVVWRLARAWEAASRSGARHLNAKLPAEDLEWLEVFLVEVSGYDPSTCPPRFRTFASVTGPRVEELLVADGKAPDLLQRAVFLAEPGSIWGEGALGLFARLPDFAACVKARPAVLREALNAPPAKRRIHALKWMEETRVDPADFVELLAELAVSSSKEVRERSEGLLRKAGPAAVPAVEHQARDGGNDERIRAVRVLWRLRGEQARPFLEGRLAAEKSKRVLEALRELTATPAPAPSQALSVVIPPVPEVSASAPLTGAVKEALRRTLEQIAQEVEKAKAATQHLPVAGRELGPWAMEAMSEALSSLQEAKDTPVSTLALRSWPSAVWKPLDDLCAHPGVELIHVIRLALLLGRITPNRPQPLSHQALEWIGVHQRAHPPGLSLRQVAAVLRAVGLDARPIGAARLDAFGARAF